MIINIDAKNNKIIQIIHVKNSHFDSVVNTEINQNKLNNNKTKKNLNDILMPKKELIQSTPQSFDYSK